MMWRALDSRFLLKRALPQAGCLIILAVTFGGISNFFSSQKLPLISGKSSYSTDKRLIDIKVAKEIFEDGRALFIDARDPKTYKLGHVPGAINLYSKGNGSQVFDVLRDISKDVILIVYCEEEDCGLSKILADELESVGYQNVQILYGGWKRWKGE